jgi:hypothetical protein
LARFYCGVQRTEEEKKDNLREKQKDIAREAAEERFTNIDSIVDKKNKNCHEDSRQKKWKTVVVVVEKRKKKKESNNNDNNHRKKCREKEKRRQPSNEVSCVWPVERRIVIEQSDVAEEDERRKRWVTKHRNEGEPYRMV